MSREDDDRTPRNTTQRRGAAEDTSPTPRYRNAGKAPQRSDEPAPRRYPVPMASNGSTRNEWQWQKRTRRERRRLHREAERTGRGPLCGICNLEIDLSLDHTHRDYLTFDHVVPLARGGDLDGEIRPAHRSCNSRRGAGRPRATMTKQQWARSERPRTLLDW